VQNGGRSLENCDREFGKGASVTWQDELQHLDAELAAGRISAEEYRMRRDVALGRAQPGTPSGGFPQQPPVQDPFPPAFKWGNTAAQGNQQPPGADTSDESTQVVPKPAAGAQPPAPSDSESTLIVNVNQVGPTAPPPAWTHQQPPAWGPQQGWGAAGSSGTPWGGSELPPAAEHGDTNWMRQGPEVFESAGKSSKGKLIAGISLGVALLAGVAVVAFFFITSPGSDSPAQADNPPQQPPPPAATIAKLPDPPAAKPTPPASSQEVLVSAPSGPPHPFNGPLDRPGLEGPRGGLLPQTVRDFALQNGMVDGWFQGTDATTPKTTLLAIRMPDQNAASALAKKYLDGQEGLATENDLSYQGVKVVSAGGATFRTAYVTHSWAVILDVSAQDGQGAKELFKNVLGRQLGQSPPTVRG
jgi:hypothetical protein